MTTWILVADESQAKLYSVEKREDEWSLVREFEHDQGRLKSREIADTSPPGRGQQGDAPGARRTAFEPRTSPKDAETRRFTQELAKFLEEAVAARKFAGLVLVAPPRFLGVLKEDLGKQTAKALQISVDKDLTMHGAAELKERLGEQVFPS